MHMQLTCVPGAETKAYPTTDANTGAQRVTIRLQERAGFAAIDLHPIDAMRLAQQIVEACTPKAPAPQAVAA